MEYLTLEEIKALNNEVLSNEDFKDLTCNPLVNEYENNGCSSVYVGYTWFIFKLVDGSEINIY